MYIVPPTLKHTQHRRTVTCRNENDRQKIRTTTHRLCSIIFDLYIIILHANRVTCTKVVQKRENLVGNRPKSERVTMNAERRRRLILKLASSSYSADSLTNAYCHLDGGNAPKSRGKSMEYAKYLGGNCLPEGKITFNLSRYTVRGLCRAVIRRARDHTRVSERSPAGLFSMMMNIKEWRKLIKTLYTKRELNPFTSSPPAYIETTRNLYIVYHIYVHNTHLQFKFVYHVYGYGYRTPLSKHHPHIYIYILGEDEVAYILYYIYIQFVDWKFKHASVRVLTLNFAIVLFAKPFY